MKTIRTYYKEHIERNKKMKRWISGILGLLVLLSVIVFIRTYNAIMKPNTMITNDGEVSLYIHSDDDFETIKNKLYSDSVIINRRSFEWLAKKLDYPQYIKSGHYVIKDGMNNNQLLNMLRSGSQIPIDFTFNNIRTIEQFAKEADDQLELDSLSILKALNEDSLLKEMGFKKESFASLFIPNTYELYWNINPKDFIEKMTNEYKKFWNDTRLQKAKEINLTPIEVSILASIVDKETTKTSEMSRIAGVYLNRINKRWLLQADPTLVFALGDFEIKRVLDVHKEIESPYNTYKYIGLPPGPICIPSIAAIDAVLNAEKHRYFYFCAKDDLSGFHVFARNIREHNINAEKYRKALNKKRIYK